MPSGTYLGVVKGHTMHRHAQTTTGCKVLSEPKCFIMPSKIGRPHPVFASHPTVAGKPSAQDVLELPSVTSKKASPGNCSATCQILVPRKPSGGKPALSLWSMIMEKMPAVMGHDCEVPCTPTPDTS